MDTLDGLSPEQRAALLILDRDIGVLASAGTGKTTLLAAYYTRLVKSGVPIERILAFTFTEKAAEEMRGRIGTALAESASPGSAQDLALLWSQAAISTLHHFSARVCRENAHLLGISPDFEIVESELSRIRYRSLLRDRITAQLESGDTDILAAATHYGIEMMEDLLAEAQEKEIPREALQSLPFGPLLSGMGQSIRLSTRTEKQSANLYDFEDLEREALALLQERPEIRARYQTRFAHILVDELQDLNPRQAALIHCLHDPRQNHLFFVGDPKQAIYGFRGSDAAVYTRFWEELKARQGHTAVLTENWRAAPPLIAFTNALFAPLFSGDPIPYSPLLSSKPSLDRSYILHRALEGHTANERRQEEASHIANGIVQLQMEGTALSEIAVLARNSRFFDFLAPLLRTMGVPCELHKSRKFADEPFILSLLALSHFLIDPDTPQYRLEYRLSPLLRPFDFLSEGEAIPVFRENAPSARLEALRRFCREKINRELWRTDYEGFLYFRFLNTLALEEKRGPKGRKAWHTWLSLFEAHSPQAPGRPAESEKEAVSLLTVHASKGLEFEVVFLADLSARSRHDRNFFVPDPTAPQAMEIAAFPGREAGLKRETEKSDGFIEAEHAAAQREQEELKRLLYVAVTRAKCVFAFCTAPPSKKNRDSDDWGDDWNSWLVALLGRNALPHVVESFPL